MGFGEAFDEVNKVNEQGETLRGGKHKFWLVSDPVSDKSTIEDIVTLVDVMALNNIIMGTNTSDNPTRFAEEHSELYPEDKKAEAMSDAIQRLEKVQGK